MYRRISNQIIITIILLFLVLLGLNHHVSAQNNFSLGVFGYDQPFPGHAFNTNEQNLLLGLNSNFIFGVLDTSHYDDIINFGNINDFSMGLECDPTSDPVTGPFYPCPGNLYNTALWPYICTNAAANIDSIEIEQFIDNVYSEYPSDAGLNAILVAHQGETDDPDHWPYIQHACSLINESFGDNVESIAIWNVFQWYGGQTGLENFFRTVDSLDVYHHEFYPFHVGSQYSYPPNDSSVFVGNEFQTNYIDNNIINSYQQTQQALENSGNTHTRWELIMQTQRSWSASNGHFWRRPNQSEIWLQAFLAISRGAKGVHSYLYHSYQTSSSRANGLVDRSATRQPINTPNYNQPYNNVAQLYDHLSELGPYLLPLSVDTAFTWTGTSTDYIQNITGDSLDGTHRTIEVSICYEYNSNDYFMLINRRCNRDSSGVWVNAFPQHITVTITPPNGSGTYQIRDLYSDELYVTSDKTFRNIEILAGRGRVFELRKIFDQNETWANTVNISSHITIPSGKTLTIQANSAVKFHNATYLHAQGKLTANGTSTEHIKFTAAATNPARGSWSWIKFDNYASGSSLNYCDIEYAQTGIWVYGTNANPTIQNCEIYQCSWYGVRIENNRSKTTFKYNNFHDISIFGVFLMTSYPTMLNITATDNGNAGLFCYNSSPKIGSIETMEDYQSKFSNNTYYGIRCIGASGSNPTIYRNSKINPYGGHIRLTGNGSNGIRAESGSQPHLGESSFSPGYNSIYSNGSYEVYNDNSSYSINAKYNWWGSTSGPPADSCNNGLLLARPFLDYDPGNPTKGGFIPPLTSDDTSHITQLQRGEIYLAAGELEKALPIFESIISSDHKSGDAKYALSNIVLCYQELDWHEQIVSYLDKLTELYQKQDIGYLAMVQSLPWLETDAEYNEAIKRCEILQQEYQSNKHVASYLPFQMGMIYKYGLKDNCYVSPYLINN